MAEKKNTEKSLERATEDYRGKVLEGADPEKDIEQQAKEGTNAELQAADEFVNAEKTSPAERAAFSHRTGLVHNHTLGGVPSDVHQALASVGQAYRADAATYNEVLIVLGKYRNGDVALTEDIRSHLGDVARDLQPRAHLYETTRILLEKYA